VAVGFDKRRGRAWKERASETQEFFETALRENSQQGKTRVCPFAKAVELKTSYK
jgi:hypothetical protein